MVSLLGTCSKTKEHSYSIFYFFFSYWLENFVKMNSYQDELFYNFFAKHIKNLDSYAVK